MPKMSDELARTGINGAPRWTLPLDYNHSSRIARLNNKNNRASWDVETESGVAYGQFEWWDFVDSNGNYAVSSRAIEAGEILFCVWRNERANNRNTNYVSINCPIPHPLHKHVNSYTYDANGPLLGPWSQSVDSQNRGSTWDTATHGMVVGGFALRFQNGLRWSYPCNSAPNDAERKLSPTQRARMDWVQPDEITTRWFSSRPYARAGGLSRMNLVIREGGPSGTVVLNVELDASQISTNEPVKVSSNPVPWCHWNMGQNFTFQAGTRYVADFWPREGSCWLHPSEQTDAVGSRDGRLGSAYYQSSATSGFDEVLHDGPTSWPMAWLESSFSASRFPWEIRS